MVNNLDELFAGILSSEAISDIKAKYETVKDLPLGQLGVDSMTMMAIVLQIEQVYGIQIDFSSFDIDNISTLSNIESYLEHCSCESC